MIAKTALLALVAFQGLDVTSDDPAPPRASAPAAEVAVVYDGGARELVVESPWVEAPEIRIDGRLDDPAWETAAVLRGFTQYEPLEGVAATQRTEVRVLLTDDAVLFGIEAFDDQRGGIRSTLAKRDGFGRSDDYVRLTLDTFNDRRRAFVFQVNPLGVQGDGLWVEGQGGRRGDPIDWNPDFLWTSAGQVSDDRYVVEIEIPFKSLRFPEAAVQDWGLQVMRRIQRNGYEASWAPITRDQVNRLAQAGMLRGLRDLDPGMFLELNPVVTGSRVGALDRGDDVFRRDAAAGDFGFNVTYGLTSNLTLDGTYNPDFSQVEADAGQITVNERFAIRLPEKRPFFLEGTDVFGMPKQLVYTRSIGNPVGAAKLSGKVGSFNVAYVGAVDEVGSGKDHPVVNLVRLKRDVGSSSTVGMVYTDRTQAGVSFNRVFGADGRFVLGRQYTVQLLAAGSADGRSGEATDWGSIFVARVNRAGRNLSMSASFEDVTDDFRARSGFIRRVGVTEGRAQVGYRWRGGRGALVESWGPSVEFDGTWSRDDFWSGRGPEESEVQLNVSASLRGNVGGFVSLSRSSFSVDPAEYAGLEVAAPVTGGAEMAFRPGQDLFGGLYSLRLRSWISRWERARVSVGAGWSETPIFDRSFGLPADLADSWSADVGLTLYPTSALSMDVGARHATLRRKRDGSTYSSATIPRLQARYQFSRALFVRAIGEYAAQERGDVLDPVTGRPVLSCGEACVAQTGSDRYDFSVEGLVGYEPSPGTVVFVGYSRQMRDAVSFRFRDVRTQADGLFVKLSYRFRM